ncbi:MAG: hypothetical protein AB7E61_06275 [Acholeplasmataceae bacterium]
MSTNMNNKDIKELNVLAKPDKRIAIKKAQNIKKRQDEIIDEINDIQRQEDEKIKQSFFIKDIDTIHELPGWIKCDISDIAAVVKHDNIIIIANAKGEIFPLTANTHKKIEKVKSYLKTLIDDKHIEIRTVNTFEILYIKTEDLMKIKNLFRGDGS